ncbi:hypothetical protein SOVF_089800 [Spinacia oleracea]|nr:hypothetical protein SOVF_089800 [Spinacia oleracea]
MVGVRTQTEESPFISSARPPLPSLHPLMSPYSLSPPVAVVSATDLSTMVGVRSLERTQTHR